MGVSFMSNCNFEQPGIVAKAKSDSKHEAYGQRLNISFKLNGREFALDINPDERLLDLIRDRLGLIGTKEGCSVGECGACTVIMNGTAVNSCIIPAARANGAEILTIEGLSGGMGDELHPLQRAFLEKGAVQCGYCTPGMILSAKAFLDQHRGREISRDQIKEGISGNICRCTGYQKIIDAIYLFARERDRAE